jgi:glycosyltransferase involved in cell wall biosynthesis
VTVVLGSWQIEYFTSAFAISSPKVRLSPVKIANNSASRNLWSFASLRKQCAQAEIVHLAMPMPFRRGSFGGPVVVSLHDLYPYDIPENFGFPRVLFNRLFLRHSLRACDAIMCGSDFTLRRLRATPLAEHVSKAVRIYQCVDEPMSPSAPSCLAEVNGKRLVLAVAQHRPNKNLSLLLESFATLVSRPSYADMMLVVAGKNGPETELLRSVVARHSLQSRVMFVSSFSDPEMQWLYQNCALLVAPSRIEGFGMPVVEGLAGGCTVVCSDIPVFREIAGDSCLYFSLDSASARQNLANTMERALAGASTPPPSLKRFSLQAIGSQLIDLYSELLNRSIASEAAA